MYMRVVFFQRKPRTSNFSIENLFDTVRRELPLNIKWEVNTVSFFSNGFFPRLAIAVQAAFAQGDVNHVTGDINFAAILLHKRRTLLTIHDLAFMNHPHPLVRWILKWFWIKLPVYRAEVISTISEASKSELLKYVSIDSHRIRVIYNPVSSDFCFRSGHFNKNEPVILQVGTKFNKNVHRLVRALKGIPCRLNIIGELNESLKLELKVSQISYTVRTNLSQNEIVEIYEEADVVAFMSTVEGFGLPILEAQATGRVVITSNVSSMPEVAGEGAHLVNPFDEESMREGILKVINDDTYRNELIKKGLVNIRRFEPGEIARQYAEIYELLYNHYTI